jgi:hypothetical protein
VLRLDVELRSFIPLQRQLGSVHQAVVCGVVPTADVVGLAGVQKDGAVVLRVRVVLRPCAG